MALDRMAAQACRVILNCCPLASIRKTTWSSIAMPTKRTSTRNKQHSKVRSKQSSAITSIVSRSINSTPTKKAVHHVPCKSPLLPLYCYIVYKINRPKSIKNNLPQFNASCARSQQRVMWDMARWQQQQGQNA